VEVLVADPVRLCRLTDQEGQRLQQIVRRGSTNSVRYRQAMMILASAGGNRVPVIAELVAANQDTVREVIHRFNEIGLAHDPTTEAMDDAEHDHLSVGGAGWVLQREGLVGGQGE
jgi:hypothetical protein